jgi:hypothetical protein
MLRWDILNRIAAHIQARRYLEIGVQTGASFHAVNVAEKVGVDPDPNAKATFCMTSDDYFASLDPLDPAQQFDLVFVDGLHVREQAARDVRNALAHLSPRGAIVMHDCSPLLEEQQIVPMRCGIWTGDVWKAWVDLRAELHDREMMVVDADMGCGVILPAFGTVPEFAHPGDWDLTWERFVANRTAWLNLTSPSDFLARMDERDALIAAGETSKVEAATED